jgi:Protein of unknown function (DUF2393)
MGDSEKEQPFSPVREEEKRSLAPMAIGGVLVLLAIAAVVFVGRAGKSSGTAGHGDPNLAKIQINDLHMATAQNFAGGSVTYIEGKITNNTDRKITGARVEVIFKNALGEVAQDEKALPVTVLLPNVPYVDYGPIDRAPLAPGQTRDFRLTLEHVSTDWDGQVPQVTAVGVEY